MSLWKRSGEVLDQQKGPEDTSGRQGGFLVILREMTERVSRLEHIVSLQEEEVLRLGERISDLEDSRRTGRNR